MAMIQAKIADVGKDPEYLTVGKTPLERVVKLLSKLDSIRVSKDRVSMVSKELDDLFYKFMEQVESIFKNLPKPLRWRSFLNNDLILLTDIPLNVRDASVKHDLNKAQTKALAKLEQVSGKVFHEIIQKGFIPFKDQKNTLFAGFIYTGSILSNLFLGTYLFAICQKILWGLQNHVCHLFLPYYHYPGFCLFNKF